MMLVAALMALVAAVCVASSTETAGVSVKPVRASGIYEVGEQVSWTLAVDGATNDVAQVRYRIKAGGVRTIQEAVAVLSGDGAAVGITADEPGWLLLEAEADLADGRRCAGRGGAVVAPGKIMPALDAPEDFDAFWAGKLDELAQVPMNPVLTPGDCGNTNVAYAVIALDNIRGTHVHGQIARPVVGTRFPAVLLLHAAGVGPSRQDQVVSLAAQGWLALDIEAHDMPVAMPDEYYQALWNGSLKNYWLIGSEDRERCYFLRMYLGCHRATAYLASREDWDGRTLVATGPSQGGLQTLIAAALHPRITAALAMVPAGCDNNAAEAGRAPGWPGWPMSTDGKDAAKVRQTGRYFDAVNFAARVTCPLLVGIGGIDTVCPPPGIYAALNRTSAVKEIVFSPEADHGNGHGRYSTRWQQWMDTLRVGAPLVVGTPAKPVAETKTVVPGAMVAAGLQRVQVPSAVMKRNVPVAVALPKGYAESGKTYPVLYLLHGAGDNEMGWYSRTPVQEMADRYGVIMVSPAVGLSWYFDSPEDKNSQFETFVAVELVKHMDANYRTTPRREGRALAGNSMGGHGALFLAIRHKDIFSAAAPMSGGMDIRGSDPQVGDFYHNWGLKHILGDIKQFPTRWNELTVINQADSLKPGELALSIDCGTGDFFLKVNRQLHEKLTANGIAHDYTESPGAHEWNYWKGALRHQMAFLDTHFKKIGNQRALPLITRDLLERQPE